MKKKERLDARVHALHESVSRTHIQSLILQGKVTVDGAIVTKAGTLVSEEAVIAVDFSVPKYVCRAGFKLEKALQEFGCDLNDKVILDAGLSTGGFTDCLLQNGARRVYGVDVGYGQVHEKIRNDSRVVVMERTNLRHLPPLPEPIDCVTLDLSFISVLKVIEVVHGVLQSGGFLIVLVKPQFEAQRKDVGKGGIIKDPKVHDAVAKNVIQGIEHAGFVFKKIIESPILGTMGNKEFLAFFQKS